MYVSRRFRRIFVCKMHFLGAIMTKLLPLIKRINISSFVKQFFKGFLTHTLVYNTRATLTLLVTDTPQCYQNEDEGMVIQKDDEIRMKIIGTRVDANDIFAVGSLMDDFLGLIS